MVLSSLVCKYTYIPQVFTHAQQGGTLLPTNSRHTQITWQPAFSSLEDQGAFNSQLMRTYSRMAQRRTFLATSGRERIAVYYWPIGLQSIEKVPGMALASTNCFLIGSYKVVARTWSTKILVQGGCENFWSYWDKTTKLIIKIRTWTWSKMSIKKIQKLWSMILCYYMYVSAYIVFTGTSSHN